MDHTVKELMKTHARIFGFREYLSELYFIYFFVLVVCDQTGKMLTIFLREVTYFGGKGRVFSLLHIYQDILYVAVYTEEIF